MRVLAIIYLSLAGTIMGIDGGFRNSGREVAVAIFLLLFVVHLVGREFPTKRGGTHV